MSTMTTSALDDHFDDARISISFEVSSAYKTLLDRILLNQFNELRTKSSSLVRRENAVDWGFHRKFEMGAILLGVLTEIGDARRSTLGDNVDFLSGEITNELTVIQIGISDGDLNFYDKFPGSTSEDWISKYLSGKSKIPPETTCFKIFDEVLVTQFDGNTWIVYGSNAAS